MLPGSPPGIGGIASHQVHSCVAVSRFTFHTAPGLLPSSLSSTHLISSAALDSCSRRNWRRSWRASGSVMRWPPQKTSQFSSAMKRGSRFLHSHTVCRLTPAASDTALSLLPWIRCSTAFICSCESCRVLSPSPFYSSISLTSDQGRMSSPSFSVSNTIAKSPPPPRPKNSASTAGIDNL